MHFLLLKNMAFSIERSAKNLRKHFWSLVVQLIRWIYLSHFAAENHALMLCLSKRVFLRQHRRLLQHYFEKLVSQVLFAKKHAEMKLPQLRRFSNLQLDQPLPNRYKILNARNMRFDEFFFIRH